MEFSRQEYWSGLPLPPPGDLLDPGMDPRSPALQADALPAEPQGKPKNTGVGSLSLLQPIFLTQESNWGLLQCRRILYQLSHQGSPQFLESDLLARSMQSESSLMGKQRVVYQTCTFTHISLTRKNNEGSVASLLHSY